MNTDNSSLKSLRESSHPYAIRLRLIIGNDVELQMRTPEIRFPFAEDYIIRIVNEYTSPREQANFIKRISVHLEAFSPACESEHAGKMLTLSLLFVAASKRVTLSFEKRIGNFPFAIRDRTQSTGFTMRGEGRTFQQIRRKKCQRKKVSMEFQSKSYFLS